MYNLEVDLVEDFRHAGIPASDPFVIANYALEFNFRSGKTDLIAERMDGKLIAFEAKLSNWRKAVNQAYRNTSFAHFSYVLLPEYKVSSALKNQTMFEKHRVGLCSMGKNGISIHFSAPHNDPIQTWLTISASEFIMHHNKYEIQIY